MKNPSTPKVTIVDYGIGNLLSVRRAFEAIEASPEITGDPKRIAVADRLVLPGVGAFGNGMDELKKGGLVDVLREYVTLDRPFLGICVGMQLMFEVGREFGNHEGLGFMAGEVATIPLKGADGVPHKVPHIGWNELIADQSWDGTIFDRIDQRQSVYFVHSFAAVPADPDVKLAHCIYDGLTVTAAVRRGAMTGCQFHPEKSGPAGLRILESFVRL